MSVKVSVCFTAEYFQQEKVSNITVTEVQVVTQMDD